MDQPNTDMPSEGVFYYYPDSAANSAKNLAICEGNNGISKIKPDVSNKSLVEIST